jgi:hypothetical protein
MFPHLAQKPRYAPPVLAHELGVACFSLAASLPRTLEQRASLARMALPLTHLNPLCAPLLAPGRSPPLGSCSCAHTPTLPASVPCLLQPCRLIPAHPCSSAHSAPPRTHCSTRAAASPASIPAARSGRHQPCLPVLAPLPGACTPLLGSHVCAVACARICRTLAGSLCPHSNRAALHRRFPPRLPCSGAALPRAHPRLSPCRTWSCEPLAPALTSSTSRARLLRPLLTSARSPATAASRPDLVPLARAPPEPSARACRSPGAACSCAPSRALLPPASRDARARAAWARQLAPLTPGAACSCAPRANAAHRSGRATACRAVPHVGPPTRRRRHRVPAVVAAQAGGGEGRREREKEIGAAGGGKRRREMPG